MAGLRAMMAAAAMASAMASALAAAPGQAWAADPAPIQGSTVMGDKGRSGPDGWSWAPVTRDQGAGKAAPGAGAATPNKRPDPQAGRTLSPGQDPGTPATASATNAGPGSLSTSAGDRKP